MNKVGKVFATFELNFDKEIKKYNGNIACAIKRSEVASDVWTVKALGYYT